MKKKLLFLAFAVAVVLGLSFSPRENDSNPNAGQFAYQSYDLEWLDIRTELVALSYHKFVNLTDELAIKFDDMKEAYDLAIQNRELEYGGRESWPAELEEMYIELGWCWEDRCVGTDPNSPHPAEQFYEFEGETISLGIICPTGSYTNGCGNIIVHGCSFFPPSGTGICPKCSKCNNLYFGYFGCGFCSGEV
jgi:hypothetical protein